MAYERHGLTGTRIYRIWTNMIQRCYNTTHKGYKWYGGKGITVCTDWKNSFVAFKAWAIDNGYSDELTIDRKYGDGNYCPSNCHWITRKEQGNNISSNRMVTVNGVTLNVTQWAELSGISKHTLTKRLNNGWKSEDILKIPDRRFSTYGNKKQRKSI